MINIHNKVQIIGTISDLSIHSYSTDIKGVRFKISANTIFFDQSGSKRKEQTTHECIAWEREANILKNNISEGHIVAIEGLIISPASSYFENVKCSTLIQVNELLILNTR